MRESELNLELLIFTMCIHVGLLRRQVIKIHSKGHMITNSSSRTKRSFILSVVNIVRENNFETMFLSALK